MIQKIDIEKLAWFDKTLANKLNEIIETVNDLQQIIYDFTGHMKP